MRCLSFIRVDGFSANPHDVVNNKARASEPRRKLLQDINETKVCGYNVNTNHKRDRQSCYRKTMQRYHAISRNDSQSQVLYHLDPPNKQINRTVENPQLIVFHTISVQQKSLGEIQGKIQAAAFDQDICGVWVHSPQTQYKTWIPEVSENKHPLCETESKKL